MKCAEQGVVAVERLHGRVALVTGAASGIGEATAKRLASEGAAVVGTDIQDAPGAQVVKDISESGGHATYLHLDVTSQPEWEAAVAAALEEFGRLDILVNNAGLGDLAVIEDTSLEDWNRTIGIDQTGVFLGMKTAAAALAASGHGSVITSAPSSAPAEGLARRLGLPCGQGRRPHADEERRVALVRQWRPRELGTSRIHRHPDPRPGQRHAHRAGDARRDPYGAPRQANRDRGGSGLSGKR